MTLALVLAAVLLIIVVGFVLLRRRCWACGTWNRGKGPSCRICGMPTRRAARAGAEGSPPVEGD